MIYKRSVVLSSLKGGKEKAVLTLECDGGDMVGNIRLYNFDKEPDGILSVGILNDGKVTKAGLVRENNNFYTFKINSNESLNAFTCALVNFNNGNVRPLLQGSTNGIVTSEERLCNSLSIFEEDASVQKVQSVLDKNQVFIDEQEEIDDLIEQEVKNIQDIGCAGCKYRDAFYKLADDTTPMSEQKEETFFDSIKEQVDELFAKYPEEEILKQILPDSKWVKIDCEEKGEYYVVGIMYENNNIKYVCYGIPGVYQDEPPKELKGFCQWLPIDTTKEKGFGYWVTYQDAETGENVTINYETI